MNSTLWSRAVLMLCLMAPVSALAWAAPPQGVSPGAPDRALAISDPCPTFSWGAVEGAASYELVVYTLGEAGARNLDEAQEVLAVSLPGSATSWTPSAEQSLSPGRSYLWFVRALSGQSEEQGDWSRGRLFRLPAMPSAEQVRKAMDTLQAYMANSRESRDRGLLVEEKVDEAAPALVARPGGPRAVPGSTAAITGELPHTSGESYGIVGTSNSPAGAGLAGVNTDGGPDLVLDGSEDASATDADFYHDGIDRSSTAAELFTIENSGTGTMKLDVNGDIDVEDLVASGTFTGNGSLLTLVDADELDGQHGSFYRNASNLNAGTVPTSQISGTYPLTVTFNNVGNSFTGTFTGNGSGLTGISFPAETDPVYSADPAFTITSPMINNWNTAYGWGNHAAAGYDTTNDPWTVGSAVSTVTTASVGIGMAAAPSFKLHIDDNTLQGRPHMFLNQLGMGDAFTLFTTSGAIFSQGIDSADGNFKITSTPDLTQTLGGFASFQGDGITLLQAYTGGIVDLNNQSRARAWLVWSQLVGPSTWTPIEFFDAATSPGGYDQQNEFTPSSGPGIGGSFSPRAEGFYQINARTELRDPAGGPLPPGMVAIAIWVNGAPYANGNTLETVLGIADPAFPSIAPNVSDVVWLVPGDVVEIYVWHNFPVPVALTAAPWETYVSIHKVS